MQRKALFLCLGIILSISCLCSPTSLLSRLKPTSIPTTYPEILPPTATDLPPTTEPDLTLLSPEPTKIKVDPDSPYLILATADTLLITDENGDNLHTLVSDVVIAQPLYQLIQPGGHLLAVIQTTGAEYDLLLVDLSTESTQVIDQLTKNLPIDLAGTPEFEAMRAITEQPSIAWSADGLLLAYTAASEESGSNVFVYDHSNGKTIQIEQDPSQSVQPSWNSNGNWLAFLTVDAFGTGAGIAMNSLWAYQTGTEQTTLVADLSSSSGEELLGWSGEDTLVVQSWNPMCGYNSLRRVNLAYSKTEMIRKECFTSAAVNDEGGILYGTGEHAWLVPGDQKKGAVIVDGNIADIDWLHQDSIFKVTRGEMPLLSLDRWGRDMQTAPENGIQDVTMYGAIWAWTDAWGEAPGVWTSGMGLDTQKVFESPAYSPIWTPHNDLLFISENQLYRATFLSYADATPIADLPNSIMDSAWAQFNIY